MRYQFFYPSGWQRQKRWVQLEQTTDISLKMMQKQPASITAHYGIANGPQRGTPLAHTLGWPLPLVMALVRMWRN